MATRQISCAALILCLLPAGRSGAQITVETGVPSAGTAYHVVRPGETLEYLAAFYLGSHERWREIWGLNPEIPNPHLIRPGQRLKVAAQLYWSAKSLKAAALRSFHPEWTEDQVQRRVREIFLCGAG